MEEEMRTNYFNFGIQSPSTGVGKFCKEPSKRFSVEKFGTKETAEMCSEASVQNEFLEHSDSEHSPVSVDKQIKFVVAKIKQRIRARLNLKSFQQLDECMTSIFRILDALETKLTNQMDGATRNCSSSLKKMERVCKEIKLAMQKQADMQRQQFKDLQYDLLEIKSIMLTVGNNKTCSCFSSKKECTKYSVEESKSMKSNSSKQHIDNENEKESTQKGKDVKDEKDFEGLPGFHHNSLLEHLNRGLGQVACHIPPAHSHKMDENVVINIENEINSLQNDGEAVMPWNIKMTENAETTMPCIDCNDDADMLDDLPPSACPPDIWKRNLFHMKKQENFLHPSIEKKNSEKCKNLRNCGGHFSIQVSPKVSISNVLMSQAGRGLPDNTDCNEEGTQNNRMGTQLSTSAGNSNIFNIIEPSPGCEGMNQFDKGILREEMGKDMDLKDILGNKFTESLVNKDKSLNSNTDEKQRSNMEEYTYACRKPYTEKQLSTEGKKTKRDERHVSAKILNNHCPSSKRVKCQAQWLRRTSHRFNESEVECLISAVEKFGTGRWRDIKEMYFSTLMCRTAGDLKDKWKSLLHSAVQFSVNQNFRTSIPGSLLKRVLSVHVKGH